MLPPVGNPRCFLQTQKGPGIAFRGLGNWSTASGAVYSKSLSGCWEKDEQLPKQLLEIWRPQGDLNPR